MIGSNQANVCMPWSDRLLSSLLLGLAIYAAVFSVPLLIVGAFTGPTVLAGGLIHLVLALMLFLIRGGLHQGKPWARWSLVLLSALGVTMLPIAITQESIKMSKDNFTWICPFWCRS